MALALSLSTEKATHCASIIDKITQDGHISHALLESLSGRLGFSQTAVFGRFARAMLKPLYTKLYDPRYTTALTTALTRNLRLRVATLLNILPVIISFARCRPGWILYTDAAFDMGPAGDRIGSIYFLVHAHPVPPPHTHNNAELAIAGRPGGELRKFLPQTSTIFGMELMAIVLFI